MNKELNPEAEAKLKADIAEVDSMAMQTLRMTLRKGFNPKEGGYGETVEEARFNIIHQADKQINSLCSVHLKKWG